MLRTARNGGFWIAQSSGLASVVANSMWRQRRLLILCYHGISLQDEHQWSDLYVSPQHFEQRLRLLRDEGCSVLPLDDAFIRLQAGTLPSRSVAITFDDGAYDFHARALPLLRKYSMPVTLYLTTYYCSFQRPVFDTVSSYLLWRGKGKTIDLSDIVENGRNEMIPIGDQQRAVLHRKILDDATSAGKSALEKDVMARRLAEMVNVDYDFILRLRMLHLMSPNEVRSLDSALVDVQLHTHRHRTPRCKDLFQRELDDNRDAIQSMLSRHHVLRHFCFPSGDYSRELVEWLRGDGIVSATTCDTQLASAKTNPLLLPRLVDTMSLPEVHFRAWLSGIASFVTPNRTPRYRE